MRMRASDIATPFDLVSRWLVPNKDDITYYNFTSNTARSNPTKVTGVRGLAKFLLENFPYKVICVFIWKFQLRTSK